MEMSRRRINLIGGSVVTAVVVIGSLLVMVPQISSAQSANVQSELAANTDQATRAELAELEKQNSGVAQTNGDLSSVRRQVTAHDELRDASALASEAARSSGARIVAITFANRQVFVAPTGLGVGDGGTPTAPQATAVPNTSRFQLPVTFEVEVTSTTQAAAFLDGLRLGTRLLQVVQAQCSSTNDPAKLTLTVDALLFSAAE
jgi:hypothetical protein